jgi:hypothetical protein
MHALFCNNNLPVLMKLWSAWEGAEKQHVCDASCVHTREQDTFLCTLSGNVHICHWQMACERAVSHRGTRSCPISKTTFQRNLTVCAERLASEFHVNPASSEVVLWDQEKTPENASQQWINSYHMMRSNAIDPRVWNRIVKKLPAEIDEFSCHEIRHLLQIVWPFVCHFDPERLAMVMACFVHTGLRMGTNHFLSACPLSRLSPLSEIHRQQFLSILRLCCKT